MKTALALLALLALAGTCQAITPAYQYEFSAPAMAAFAAIPTPQLDPVVVAKKDLQMEVTPDGFSIFWGVGGSDTNVVGVSHGWDTGKTLGDIPIVGYYLAEPGIGLEKLSIRIDGLVGETQSDANDTITIGGLGVSACSSGAHLSGGVGLGLFSNGEPAVYATLKGKW
jgi:hypothetical protein